MSGTAVVRYLLANSGGLIAVVPAARIMSGVLPLLTVLPAISVTQVDGVEYRLIKRAGAQLVTDRVQVDCLATTYPQQKSIVALIRAALPATHGTVNSIVVDSIDYVGDGPDIYVSDPIIFMQCLDFSVRYTR